MRQIRDEVLALASSPLYSYRTENKYFPVIGEGSHDAKIMFVGEAPGRNEAKTGRPFCGAAGKILDELLASANIPREEVYITNIVKDRPPQNRDPLPEEIEAYGPFLDRQIEIIQPKVIATLGRYSMVYIMQKFGLENRLDTIGKLHGQAFTAAASYGDITILPLYHPASAIYNRELMGTLREDFQKLAFYRD
ncbi:MAG TPA: uracil-DNA glycosylase [Candidatus Paceibacterota bacterium]|nr:uracil-DNA glycosylase [Candidatus Paceibacterota bacterium]